MSLLKRYSSRDRGKRVGQECGYTQDKNRDNYF